MVNAFSCSTIIVDSLADIEEESERPVIKATIDDHVASNRSISDSASRFVMLYHYCCLTITKLIEV